MKNDNRKNLIQSHLASRGVKFGLEGEEIICLFERTLGEERFSQWEDASWSRGDGGEAAREGYAVLQSIEEMNLLNSLQAELALEVTFWICSMLDTVKHPANKLFDLGCGAGNLTSWIATNWQHMEVVGFDACDNIIQAANKEKQIANLQYQVWDYAISAYAEPNTADILVCSLGIDFEAFDHRFDLDSEDIRESDAYKIQFEEAKPYFFNWRTAVKDGGHLFSVFRIAYLPHFIAVADAAAACGWSLDLVASAKIRTESETMPALVFAACQAEQTSYDLLTAFWLQQQILGLFEKRLSDPLAGVIYRLLGNKIELKRNEITYPDGNAARTVVGTAGPIGYRFTTNTRGCEALQIVPAIETENLQVSFDWFIDPKAGF